MLMKWALALASLVVVSACTAGKAERSPDQRGAASELKALLDEAVASGIPGISAAVATGAPVRPEMLFGIGSITKTFVTVVILQLTEEGRLDLNATAASLLGAAVDGIPNAEKATLAQLLNHTGGVRSWEDDPAWIHEGRGEVQLREHEFHTARHGHREGDRQSGGGRDPSADPHATRLEGHPS